ncbi:uncharacterized protein LOC121185678 isoform X2 [Toxotes jaculatrix]|uniref:uncharacterized protein LOC121185678 isoform X2 n=1 Tax=Toxotes jaculatrix TaxID=941984 RepID=UPI001B3ACD1B|nr:uncharacterized protein LOC121185678 isoform X2 [Toxotes jaculatrix]
MRVPQPRCTKPLFFLQIIWILSAFASGKTGIYKLHFSLGCQAVIPCQHERSGTDSFKWFYRRDGHTQKIQIYLQNKQGVQYYSVSRNSLSVKHNRSLVISYFTEDDQGLYWCEYCYKDNCEQSSVIIVKKEILDEIHKTFYVTAGSSFTYACPGEFANLNWSFEAGNKPALRISAVRSKTDFLTSNKSIHIVNVKRADAGKYTCWRSGCVGHRQKLLTINLSVITVHQSVDSSVPCAVICDMEFSNIKSINLSSEETVNSTDAPSNASNTASDVLKSPEYLTPVIYGTSAALACLVLMAFLIFHFRPTLWAVFSDHPSGGINHSVETSVVYSSVVIRRPAKTTYHVTDSDCVYSEINV